MTALTPGEAKDRVDLIIKKLENRMKQATIYTRTGCAVCKRAIKHLKHCGYEVDERNADTDLGDKTKAKLLRNNYRPSLPIIELPGGRMYTGAFYKGIKQIGE